MVDLVAAVQALVGLALFFAAGYFISLIFFKRNEVDAIERAVYSLTFSITIPALVIFFLNFLFRIPINTLFVYAVYLALIGASYAYNLKYGAERAQKG